MKLSLAAGACSASWPGKALASGVALSERSVLKMQILVLKRQPRSGWEHESEQVQEALSTPMLVPLLVRVPEHRARVELEPQRVPAYARLLERVTARVLQPARAPVWAAARARASQTSAGLVQAWLAPLLRRTRA